MGEESEAVRDSISQPSDGLQVTQSARLFVTSKPNCHNIQTITTLRIFVSANQTPTVSGRRSTENLGKGKRRDRVNVGVKGRLVTSF